MLKINTIVERGIVFLRLEGNLNKSNFNLLGKKVNYLLYHHGVHYFVFDFTNIINLEENIFSNIQNKLIEIFLSCGKVAMCGIMDIYQRKIGFTKDKLYYVSNNIEAFKYFNL